MAKMAARVGDLYTNPLMQGGSAGIVCAGSPTLLIGSMPALQITDAITPIPDMALPSVTTVFHNNLPLCGSTDVTMQGGSILMGDPTVIIG